MKFKNKCIMSNIYLQVIAIHFMFLYSSFVYSEPETSAQSSPLKWAQKASWEELRKVYESKEFGKEFMTEQEVLRILGRPTYRRIATAFPESGLSFTFEQCPRVMLCYEMPTYKISKTGENGGIQYSKTAFVVLGEDTPITAPGRLPTVDVTIHAVDDHRGEVQDQDGKLKYTVKEYTPKLIVLSFAEPDWWQLNSNPPKNIPFDLSVLNDQKRPLWQQPDQWAKLKKNMSTRKVEILLGKPLQEYGGNTKAGYQKNSFGSGGSWGYGVRGVGGNLSFTWDGSEGFLDSWTEPFWPYVMTLAIRSEAQADSDDKSYDDSIQTAENNQSVPPWTLLSNWEKLNKEMPERQVIKILGKPTYRCREVNTIRLYYYEGDVAEIKEVPESYILRYPDALKSYLPKYVVNYESFYNKGCGTVSFELIDEGNKIRHKTPKIISIRNPTFSQPPTHYVPYPDYTNILTDKTLERWQQPRQWERINLETSMEEIVSLLGIPRLVAFNPSKTIGGRSEDDISIYDFDNKELTTYQELQKYIKSNEHSMNFIFFYGNVNDCGYVSLSFTPRDGIYNKKAKSSVNNMREPYWPLEKKLIDQGSQEKKI